MTLHNICFEENRNVYMYDYKVPGKSKTNSDIIINKFTKTVEVGTIAIGMGLISNCISVANIFEHESISYSLYSGPNYKNNYKLNEDMGKIKITIIGNNNSKGEYTIENISYGSNKELLERVRMNKIYPPKYLEGSIKYVGKLPKRSLNQLSESDERYDREKLVHYKDINVPVKYAGKLPKKPLV